MRCPCGAPVVKHEDREGAHCGVGRKNRVRQMFAHSELYLAPRCSSTTPSCSFAVSHSAPMRRVKEPPEATTGRYANSHASALSLIWCFAGFVIISCTASDSLLCLGFCTNCAPVAPFGMVLLRAPSVSVDTVRILDCCSLQGHLPYRIFQVVEVYGACCHWRRYQQHPVALKTGSK